MQGEQRVGVLGAERPAVGGIAGLQQHGMALRRGWQRRDPADIELGSVVLDDANPAGVDVDSGVRRSATTASGAQLSQNSRATVMNSSARW